MASDSSEYMLVNSNSTHNMPANGDVRQHVSPEGDSICRYTIADDTIHSAPHDNSVTEDNFAAQDEGEPVIAEDIAENLLDQIDDIMQRSEQLEPEASVDSHIHTSTHITTENARSPSPLFVPSDTPPAPDFGKPILGNAKPKDKQSAVAMQENSENTVVGRADSPLESAELDKGEIRFRELESVLEKKHEADTLTTEEWVEWTKCQAIRQARLRKLRANQLAEREPSIDDDDDRLFVSENSEPPACSTTFSDANENDGSSKTTADRKRKRTVVSNTHMSDSDLNSQGTDRSKRPRVTNKASANKSRRVARQGYTENDVSDTSNQVAVKKKAIETANPTPGANKKKTHSKAETGHRKRVEPSMANVASVLGTDVFADAKEVADLPAQPKLGHATRRDQQLKELVIGLPAADKAAGNADQKALNNAIKDFTGRGVVKGAEGSGWMVAGMKTPLKHYQVLGVGFMRKRETGESLPRGGLLADVMGLGKTISMLANIVNGKLDENPSNRMPTLIIASPALLPQWRSEIEKHCRTDQEDKKYGLGRVIEQRAGSRVESNDTIRILSQSAIILTTYQEVNRSYPKCVPPPNLTTAQQKDDWWSDYYERHKGVLHQVKYNRVVLDEAQAIKNHLSHTSRSARALHANHYWAITGTPVLNNLKEFYSYFKLLRASRALLTLPAYSPANRHSQVPQTGSFRIFKENFCSPDDPEGIQKLGVFLNNFMVRRTHKDRLFNSRLLDLPTPQVRDVWLDFNIVERTIYEIVKKRMINRINHFSKVEGVQKNYSNIWTMILRLRQLCGHLLTIQSTVGDVLEREDFEKLNRLSQSTEELDEQAESTLIRLQQVLAKNDGEKTINAGAGYAFPSGAIDTDETAEATLGGRHGLTYKFRKYLDSLKASKQFEEMKQRSYCASCNLLPDQPVITSCSHMYCKTCLESHQHLSARRGHDAMRCVKCGEIFIDVEEVPEGEFSTDSSLSEDIQAENSPKRKRPNKKANNDGEMEDWINMRGEVLPSTKTIACKALLQNWFKDDPAQKVIVFTQFIPIIHILSKMCQTEQWRFVKYHGGMKHESRKKAIEDFADGSKGVQIMLSSLKCGGLGLNLTMASRVICFDPWWNEATEQQAFCRVYRIGQNQTTMLTRFLVKNTIDAAMKAMKDRKQIEIDKVMESAKTRPDVKEVMRLFGRVEEDSEGRPFIFAGDEEDSHLYHDDDVQNEYGNMGNEA